MKRVEPWKTGDERCHCTHCECCGWLFRTADIHQHLREAHLGGRAQEQQHLREGARLLAITAQLTANPDAPIDVGQYAEDLAAWALAEETRQKEVRE